MITQSKVVRLLSMPQEAQYGIDKDRAVYYHADGIGTQILYESVANAVCNVRASAPLGADWSEEINADYKQRGKKNG